MPRGLGRGRSGRSNRRWTGRRRRTRPGRAFAWRSRSRAAGASRLDSSKAPRTAWAAPSSRAAISARSAPVTAAAAGGRRVGGVIVVGGPDGRDGRGEADRGGARSRRTRPGRRRGAGARSMVGGGVEGGGEQFPAAPRVALGEDRHGEPGPDPRPQRLPPDRLAGIERGERFQAVVDNRRQVALAPGQLGPHERHPAVDVDLAAPRQGGASRLVELGPGAGELTGPSPVNGEPRLDVGQVAPGVELAADRHGLLEGRRSTRHGRPEGHSGRPAR